MNVFEFDNLFGNEQNALRVSDELLAKTNADASSVAQRIHDRLKHGYALTRYRTLTGENTAAIVKGALSPTVPPEVRSSRLTFLSSTGSDLQIFDEELGLMDITYSTAWSLGKTLALSDRAFSTSLSRLRSMVDKFGLGSAKQQKFTETNTVRSRQSTLTSLTDSIVRLNNSLARDKSGSAVPSDIADINSSSTEEPLDILHDNEVGTSKFKTAAFEKTHHFAGNSDNDGERSFSPKSTDWMVVLSWITDKMFLSGIPAQYLIIDPTMLLNESLRFFYIDPHWINVLVDGALSIANHSGKSDDTLRKSMKGAFDAHFDTVDPDLGYRPQIPTCGFFLRSHLVKDSPDLHVTALTSGPEHSTPTAVNGSKHERAPALRQSRLAEDTLFCIFDHVPSSIELHTSSTV